MEESKAMSTLMRISLNFNLPSATFNKTREAGKRRLLKTMTQTTTFATWMSLKSQRIPPLSVPHVPNKPTDCSTTNNHFLQGNSWTVHIHEWNVAHPTQIPHIQCRLSTGAAGCSCAYSQFDLFVYGRGKGELCEGLPLLGCADAVVWKFLHSHPVDAFWMSDPVIHLYTHTHTFRTTLVY